MGDRWSRRYWQAPEAEPSPELQAVLSDLESSDEHVQAGAVRRLCPCRGVPWELPVFDRVMALRNDSSPVVQRAVQHDLRENSDWNARTEGRRLKGRQLRQAHRQVRAEIEGGLVEEEAPPPHSLAWRKRRKPR
jgi:hypothetical protein